MGCTPATLNKQNGAACSVRSAAERNLSSVPKSATARPIQKVSRRCGEIALLTSSNCRIDEHNCRRGESIGGTTMTITMYLAATALAALILWAVLGLLIQES